MGKTYKDGDKVCKGLSDGSTVCVSKKAWSVFYATLRKKKMSESTTVEEWLTEHITTEQKNKEIQEAIRESEEKKKENEFLNKWLKAKGLENES